MTFIGCSADAIFVSTRNSFVDDGGGGGDVTAAQVPATISDVKLVNAFFRGRRTPEQDEGSSSPCDAGATSRSNKDSVNFLIKNASRLTSIEEAAVEGYSTASSGSSGSSGQATNEGKTSSSESATLTSGQRQRQQLQQEQQRDSKYPNIDFLENDVSLWDAFFLRSKTSGRFQSVLRPTAPPPPAPPPPLPVRRQRWSRPPARQPAEPQGQASRSLRKGMAERTPPPQPGGERGARMGRTP